MLGASAAQTSGRASDGEGEAVSLRNRKIVVIGGSCGIGRATAKAARAAGAEVVIVGRSSNRLKSAAAEMDDEVEAHRADMSKEAAAKKLFTKIGKFDHLVLTTVDGPFKPFMKTTVAEFRLAIDSKLWVVRNAVRYGAGRIKKGGSIILTSGFSVHKPLDGLVCMATVNSAVEAMSGYLAYELAPIRVNVVCPGVIDTPTFDGLPPKEKAATFRSVAGAVPEGRVGTPEEVAEVYLYLAESSYINGAVIAVDGGIRHARDRVW